MYPSCLSQEDIRGNLLKSFPEGFLHSQYKGMMHLIPLLLVAFSCFDMEMVPGVTEATLRTCGDKPKDKTEDGRTEEGKARVIYDICISKAIPQLDMQQ